MATATDALARFDEVLKTTTVAYLDRARAYPFVKWAGGKRGLIPNIVQLLPETFNDYWEPFVGGGAAFFALDSRIRKAHLSDLNLDLILTYKMVRKDPGALIAALKGHAAKHDRTYYQEVRSSEPQDPVELAARFIYLNKTCYNGLYRVNKQGKFNVPCGRYSSPIICDEDNLLNASKVLGKASVKRWSFDHIRPKAGDLVYCDPPYHGTFAAYTGVRFDDNDHKRLRDLCVQWVSEGVHVIVSNSDTPYISRLYKDRGGGGGPGRGEPLSSMKSKVPTQSTVTVRGAASGKSCFWWGSLHDSARCSGQSLGTTS